MSESRFDPNDPRLTAYVLGELDEAERAAVERQLEDCAQSRTAVEEIRNLAGLLSEQLPSEPAPALTEAQRDSVVAEAEKVAVADNITPPRRKHRWMLVTAVSTLAAAAGLLLAVSPSFRSLIPYTSQFPSFTNSDDADYDNTLALNESSDEQQTKEALYRKVAQTDDADGLSTDARSRMRRTVKQGESADLLSVGDLKTTVGSGRFDSQQGRSAQQLGRKLAGTNAESTVANEQAAQLQKFSRYLSISEREEAVKPAPGRVSSEPGLKPNITNQPADPAGTPASDTTLKLRSLRADEFLKTLNQVELEHLPFPSEPPINWPTRTEWKKLTERRVKRQGQEGQTPGSNSASYPAFGDGLIRGGSELPKVKDFSQLEIRNGRVVGGRGGESDNGEFAAAGDGYGSAGGGFGGGGGGGFGAAEGLGQLEGGFGTESYAPIIENEFLSPLKAPLATFGIDVDTAAYSNVRRFLNQGRLPPRNAVRIEELVNYFHYDEPEPAGDDPFSVSLEAADCPWNPGHRLVRIGLKGREIDRSQRPHSNLVFLIDVSGSMTDANKLPLVKTALEMLVQQMTENDRIAIVTYASEAALKLDSTHGHNKDTILKVIRSLQANGSTNGEAGIQLAYAKAYEHRIADGTNRVILCTDGDFNVGVSDDDQLMQMVHKYADQSGVFLSIFGFGMGNLKDAKLEKLADRGNGHYGYIDNEQEAHKVFVEEMTGTLYTIAKDLKLQIEFNPYQVGAYRLIGYENRLLAAEDFDDDRKDAGDVGAGHSVTALFEIIPIDKLRQPVELKYQKVSRVKLDASDLDKKQADPNSELLTLFLRYKQPDGKTSVKREYPLTDIPNDSASGTPSENLQWSAAVAAFGMVIRDSQYRGHANYDLVSELALSAQGEDESGRRKEFLELVKKAQTIHKQLLGLRSSTPKESPQPEPQSKQDKPASSKPVEIGKTVQYWQTHQTNGHDVAKVIKVLKVLFPNMKTKPGANSGEVNILAQKSHHDKLADLIPRMTLD